MNESQALRDNRTKQRGLILFAGDTDSKGKQDRGLT